MDGPTVEHSSDSESGESWTILDNSPSYADEVPEFAENSPNNERHVADISIEKDEDTDGISIITDSDPESLPPCDIHYEKSLSEKNRPTEQHDPQSILVNSLSSNNNDHHQSIRCENDYLVDNHGIHKTYVHRRNKRLSTVLNIIMLGSVITAAGVAIGHMWGARNECMVHTPSVNKILSNLYKLQEENAYLRNKLKELTLDNNIQMQQKKADVEKITHKQNRCKKVYEESLDNKNANKAFKCIDNDNNIAEKSIENHLTQPAYESEFLNDLEKMKLTYQQNKSWLDDEIGKRIKGERLSLKRLKNSMKSTNLIKIDEEQRDTNNNFKDLVKPESDTIIEKVIHTDTLLSNSNIFGDNLFNMNENELSPNKKISYADSVKSDIHTKNLQKRESKHDFDDKSNEDNKRRMKKNKKNIKTPVETAVSEVELKKDDRYVGGKSRQERKKHDRQKSLKKQKRKNKYELWEIKGDFMMKDYDDFSVTSSQENDFSTRKPDNFRGYEKNNYISQFSDDSNKAFETFEIVSKKGEPDKHPIKRNNENKKNGKNKEFNWYDKRSALRTEARKKLEQELFGATSPNNAGWYFRRMQRRELCRTKGDNSTHRKLSKRNMNYKMKH